MIAKATELKLTNHFEIYQKIFVVVLVNHSWETMTEAIQVCVHIHVVV